MRLRLGVALSSAVVVFVGLVTLAGLLVGNDLGLLSDVVNGTPIRALAVIFVEVAVVTIALTILIGFINLLTVHITRITRGQTISARLNSIALGGQLSWHTLAGDCGWHQRRYHTPLARRCANRWRNCPWCALVFCPCLGRYASFTARSELRACVICDDDCDCVGSGIAHRWG
jgi:hypothetical protein